MALNLVQPSRSRSSILTLSIMWHKQPMHLVDKLRNYKVQAEVVQPHCHMQTVPLWVQPQINKSSRQKKSIARHSNLRGKKRKRRNSIIIIIIINIITTIVTMHTKHHPHYTYHHNNNITMIMIIPFLRNSHWVHQCEEEEINWANKHKNKYIYNKAWLSWSGSNVFSWWAYVDRVLHVY